MEKNEKNGLAQPHQQNLEPLVFQIENKQFSTNQQYYQGIELKQLAGISDNVPLYLFIDAPYEHELIENHTRVNIARPEVETFFVKDEDKLKFSINNQPFTSYKQYISGIEIRELGNIPSNEALYLDLQGKWEDDLITNEEIVDLARDGVEKFVSKKVSFCLFVNAEEFVWQSPTISFEEVVNLAFGKYNPNPAEAYTVKYKDGLQPSPTGKMSKGSSVQVKDKMKFNVTETGKS